MAKTKLNNLKYFAKQKSHGDIMYRSSPGTKDQVEQIEEDEVDIELSKKDGLINRGRDAQL